MTERERLRLRGNLRRFARAATEDVLAAIKTSGDELVESAVGLAAEDTRRLKESGRHYEEVTPAGVRGTVVFGKGDDTTEFDDVFYAGFEEFGTKKRKGRPFLFPAYRNLRKRIKNRIKRAINKAAKRSVR